MPGTIYKGTAGRVTIEGGTINLSKWEVTVTGIDLETTDFEDTDAAGIGWEVGEVGILVADVSIEGKYDASAPPFNSGGFNLYPRVVSNVVLYVSKTANKFFSFPSFRLLNARTSDEVKGKVEVSFSGKSSGSFLFPQ